MKELDHFRNDMRKKSKTDTPIIFMIDMIVRGFNTQKSCFVTGGTLAEVEKLNEK